MRRGVVATQVHGDDGVPLLRRHLDHGSIAQDAGVVHQGIELTEALQRGRNQLVGHLDLADVTLDQHRPATARLDLRDDSGAGRRVELVDDDSGTLPSAFQRFPPAQPTAGSGDDDDAVFEDSHGGEI